MATLAEMLKTIDGAQEPAASGGDKKPVSRAEFLLESAKRGVTGIAGLAGGLVDAGDLTPGMIISRLARGEGVLPQGKPYAERFATPVREVLGSDPSMQPPSGIDRYLGKAVEFGVAGGPFSALNILRAGMKIPAVMSEVGSAIGGATGATVAGDLAEKYGNRTIGELLGGILGGVAGGVSPVLVSKGLGLAKQVMPSSMDDVARTAAGGQIAGAVRASPGAVDELGRSLDVSRQVDDVLRQAGPIRPQDQFRPTLAQASGARAVGDIERSLASKSPETHGPAIARQEENLAAVSKAKETLFPSGGQFTRAPAAVQRQAEQALDRRMTQIEEAEQSLAARLPGQQQQAVGENLRTMRDQAFNVARGIKTGKYEDVYRAADDAGLKVDMTDVRDLVRQIKAADENAFADIPGTFGKVLRRYSGDEAAPTTGRSVDPEIVAHLQKEADKPVRFQELHSLMKDANSAYFAARRATDPKAAERAYFLGQLRDALEAKVKTFEGPEFGDVAAKLTEANRFYKDQYRRAFRLGVGGEIDATKRFGEHVLPEKVVDRFFTPTGMDDFYAVYGSNRDARQALTDGVLDIARRATVRDGKINASRMETFLRSNEEALAKLPEVRDSLRNIDTLNDALAQRAARVKEGQSQIARSTIAELAKTDNPQQAIDLALSSKRHLMALVSSAKSQPQRDAVVRGIVDAIPDAAAKAKVTPIDYVIANESTLAPALNRLGPRHMENLKLLAKAETIQGRADVPRHAIVPKPGEGLEELTGTTKASLLSQFRAAFITRQQGQTYVVASVLAKYGIKVRAEMAEKIQQELVANPALAQQLLQASQQRVPLKDTGNKLRDLLGSAGFRAAATADEER